MSAPPPPPPAPPAGAPPPQPPPPKDQVAPNASNKKNQENVENQRALKYKAPEWAAKAPFPELRLEVFKAGQFFEKVSVGNKLCLVLGRQPDATDVLLEHGSISRRHAVIIHGSPDSKDISEPCATLIDLGSANGTFVKAGTHRKPVKPKKPLNLEEGMCIEFGESSRSYYVRGLKPSSQGNAKTAGSKRKYTEGGYLANDDNEPLEKGTGKRLKPKEYWEQTATAFGDDEAAKAKHNKFLRLLGGKKKKK